MLLRLLNQRISPITIVVQRSLIIKSDSQLLQEMKQFNSNKQYRKTVDVFCAHKRIDDIGKCSSHIIAHLLKACTQVNNIELGSKIHHEIKSRPDNDPFILFTLIQLYMQNRLVIEAEALFKSAENPSIRIVGAMMKGYITNSQPTKAIQLYKKTKNPNDVIYILFFQACAKLGSSESLNLIKTTLNDLPPSFYDNKRLWTSIIDALIECGDVEKAESVFNSISDPPIQILGAMMKGYITNSQPMKAIRLFQTIRNPNIVLHTLFFQACAQISSNEGLNLIKTALNDLSETFYKDERLLTSLMDALIECGDVGKAESIFNSMTDPPIQIVGAMMKGHIANSQPMKAIRLYEKTKNPNEVIYILFFQACSQISSNEGLNLIKVALNDLPQSFHDNERLSTSLIDALTNCGDIEKAESIFNSIANPSIQMVGTMMKGYNNHDQPGKAIDLFNNMKQPNEVTYIIFFNACAQTGSIDTLALIKRMLRKMSKSYWSNENLLTSLLDSIIKCNDISYALLLFKNFSHENKFTNCYTVLISGCLKKEKFVQVIDLFNEMKANRIQANEMVYLNVIKALSKIGDFSLCQSTLEDIPENILSISKIQTALMNMWGKSSAVSKAEEIFQKMIERDSFVYSTMINIYGLNGMAIQAIQLYKQMPQELIDEITHICVLNACSHSGLVDEARSIFTNIRMRTEYIFTTMIDALSRASLLKEAQDLMNKYEYNHSPSLVMYMSLLSGARNAKDSVVAQQTYDRMKELFPQSNDVVTSGLTFLGNIYGFIGDLEKANEIRKELNESNLRKKAGLSWTVVNGQTYEFQAYDQRHPRSPEIHSESAKIRNELVQHGY